MSCDCSSYINCKNSSIEISTLNGSGSFGHSYTNTIISDDALGYYQKTTRSFSADWSTDKSITPGYIVQCSSPSTSLLCGRSTNFTALSHCSESCHIEKKVPFFWDRQRDILVYKHITESLDFSITSNKVAKFRVKWGEDICHKILIMRGTMAVGSEKFIYVHNGQSKTLAGTKYTFDPFPGDGTERGSTWGLYGNHITYGGDPETPDVRLILLLPQPPKQAIPLDADVLYYGFYDYNAIEGGFTETSLPAEDGGKDFFYPFWCRSMPQDQIWRATADQRYEVIETGDKLNLAGTTNWTPPEPTVFPWPFGSFALDSKDNFITSCILQFGAHAGAGGVVYNYASMGDLFEAITKAGPSMSGKFGSTYPVAPR